MKISFGFVLAVAVAGLLPSTFAADTAAAEVTITAEGGTTSVKNEEKVCKGSLCHGSENNDTSTTQTTITTTSSSTQTTTTNDKKQNEKPNTILHEYTATSDCGLYLSDTMVPSNKTDQLTLGVFAGRDYKKGDVIEMSGDLIIPILDKYKTVPYRGQHRWLSWLNYVKGTTQFKIPKNRPLSRMNPMELKRSATGIQFTDDLYHIDAFAPGLSALVASHPKYANIALSDEMPPATKDNLGMHRSKDAGVGAFSQHVGITFVATRNIDAGDELYVMPSREEMKAQGGIYQKPFTSVTPRWLENHAFCLDTLKVGKSKLNSQAGRGAFAKHSIAQGQVIAPTPLAVMKKDDFLIYESNPEAEVFSDVLNKDKVIGKELLLNYAYGHEESDLLFVPLSPMVNYINHDAIKPNAKIAWPTATNGKSPSWLNKHPLDLLDMSGQIYMNIVALRDIKPNEEIVLDYGDDWDEKWMGHVEGWRYNKNKKERAYRTAREYMDSKDYTIRTISEQYSKPYPSNLITVCYFLNKAEKVPEIGEGCWLPCDVKSREEIQVEDEEQSGKMITKVVYKTSYFEGKHGEVAENMMNSYACVPNSGKRNSKAMPEDDIAILDIWGTTDQHLDRAFRKEIRVPDGFFPKLWLTEKTVYELTPLSENLKPGQFVPITFKHTGKPVTRNAYFVGLPKDYNINMRKYAEEVGAMDHFRDVLGGRYNNPGEERWEELKEGTWYIQRPRWNSNMHWVIPWSEVARKSYLRALGKNGFDDVLEGMGTAMGLNKLTCFHNTFLGLSQADDSNMHSDFYETQRSSFDFLAPIIMANTTKPELDLESQDQNIIVGVKYRYGVAAVMGDWTYHKSAAADYTAQNEIRVVSSIYCSDITAENRDSLMKMYKEEAPAPFKHLFDLPTKEVHWDQAGTRLPKPPRQPEDHASIGGTNFNLAWPEGT